MILILNVADGIAVDYDVTFLRRDCNLRLRDGFLKKVTCRSADRKNRAVFRKVPPVLDVFRFIVHAKRIEVPEFTLDRLTVVLTTSDVDRRDLIGNIVPCVIKQGKLANKIKCREPDF